PRTEPERPQPPAPPAADDQPVAGRRGAVRGLLAGRRPAGENDGGPAASGKRPPRRVVFDEEDDLDVPDFLKGP
ncbi:cell division protein FtsZ, partial [Actinomadura sp. WAC 06369]